MLKLQFLLHTLLAVAVAANHLVSASNPTCIPITKFTYSVSLLPRHRFIPKVQQLRGGGNSMGADGDAITEEQAGEELIKAASTNNVDLLDPPGIEILVSSGAPVNYQVFVHAFVVTSNRYALQGLESFPTYFSCAESFVHNQVTF